MKNLTDVDAFTTPIEVPEGTDSRNDAAGDVESIAQRLANRTHYLNQRTAKLATTNTFTDAQTFSSTINVVGAATIPNIAGSTTVAADLTVGDDLVVTGDATIPTILGSINVANDIVVGDDIDAGGDIYAADDVIAGDEFQYATPPTRTVFLKLFDSFGEGSLDFGGGTNHVLLATGGQVHVWPISLPEGAVLSAVEALVQKPGTGTTNLRVYRKATYDWSNPVSAQPSDTQQGIAGVSTAGDWAVAVTGLALTANNGTNEVFAHITAGDAGDRVYGLRVTFTDPGPRNH